MGVYDIVCGIQVKCTPDQTLKEYKLGDLIDLKNGIYIGYEGWFNVRNRKVVDSGKDVYDKWGNLLSIEEILINNPIVEGIRSKDKYTAVEAPQFVDPIEYLKEPHLGETKEGGR